MIDLNNYWTAQTAIFLVIFLLAVFASLAKKTETGAMPKETSNELRGLAILGVIFAHLTYGKFYGTQFLFPLGIWGGIAVNLFFFLSGYGLAASAISHPKTPWQFYKKRLSKLYWPLWLSLILFLTLDLLLLQRLYPTPEILSAFIGFFPQADLWLSINSPLWFLTPLLFYYILFPFIFNHKHPIISTIAVLLVSYLAFWPGWPVNEQILKFYQIHFLAFPLGVLSASLMVSSQITCKNCLRQHRCSVWLSLTALRGWARKKKDQKLAASFFIKLKELSGYWKFILIIVFSVLAGYTAYYSGVGQGIWREQLIALLTMFCLLAVFIIKKSKFKILEIVGIYSLEIYLLHWPLLSRYDLIYPFFPPAIGTLIYLAVLLSLAVVFNKLVYLYFKK